jgi:hypothetical protein
VKRDHFKLDFTPPTSQMAPANDRAVFRRKLAYGGIENDFWKKVHARCAGRHFGLGVRDFGAARGRLHADIVEQQRRLLTTAPNVIGVDLKKVNFDAGAPVMTLDPNNIDLTGDVTAKLERATAPF